MKTPSSVSGNHPFFGPVNFFHDDPHLPITDLSFHRSRTVFSPTPKTAAALWFFFSACQTTSCFNFAVYDSLLDFYHPCPIIAVHGMLEQAPDTL
jgi:hypothetical protein